MKFSIILKEFLEENYKLTPLDVRILKRIHSEYIKETDDNIPEKNIILYNILKDKLHITDFDSIVKYIKLFTFNYRENGDYENIDKPIIKNIEYPDHQMALAENFDIPPELLIKMSYRIYILPVYEDMTTNNLYSIGTKEEANKSLYLNIEDYTYENGITGWNVGFIKQFITPNEEWVADESSNRARMDTDEMDIEEKLERAVFKYRYNGITKMIDQLAAEHDKTQNEDEKINIRRKINSYVEEQDKIELKCDELVFDELQQNYKDEIESDILSYYEENYGSANYDILYQKNVIKVDFDDLTESAIALDGRGQYLSSDGTSEKIIEYNNKNYYIYNSN